MREGLTSKGVAITPDYRGGYANFKASTLFYRAKPPTPDLFLSGSFHDSLIASFDEKTLDYSVDSDNTKDYFSDLLQKYEDVLGITNESDEELFTLIDDKMFEAWENV